MACGVQREPDGKWSTCVCAILALVDVTKADADEQGAIEPLNLLQLWPLQLVNCSGAGERVTKCKSKAHRSGTAAAVATASYFIVGRAILSGLATTAMTSLVDASPTPGERCDP